MSNLGKMPAFQPWQQPRLSQAEGATSRSLMGPIEFILDDHAAWHKRMGECISALVNIGSSVKIVPGGSLPPIYLDGDEPATSRQPRTAPAPASSFQQPTRQQPRQQHQPQLQPQQHSRQPNSYNQQSSRATHSHHYGPAQPTAEATRQQLRCEGCGRNGHDAPECRFKGHRNWNKQWAHVPFDRSPIIGVAVEMEARGTSQN